MSTRLRGAIDGVCDGRARVVIGWKAKADIPD
jgi:hypothetical protein